MSTHPVWLVLFPPENRVLFSFRRSKSARGPVGIDCGSDALRLLQLRGSARELVSAQLEVPIARSQPHLAVTKGESGAEWIRAAEDAALEWKRAGFRSRHFLLSIPSPRSQFQIVSLPSLAPQDFDRAACWEASDRFGMDHEDLSASALPTNAPATTDGKSEYLLVAAERSFVEAMLEPFLRRGLEPIAVEPRFASAARVASRQARRESDRSRVRGVVVVGREETTILVLRGDEIAFARELPLGSLAMDQAVSERLALSLDDAAMLRWDAAETLQHSHAAQAARDASRGVLASIANEATMCFRYYSVRFRGGTPPVVLVLGDGDIALTHEIRNASGIPSMLDDEQGSVLALAKSLKSRSCGCEENIGRASRWIAAFGAASRSMLPSRASTVARGVAA